MLHILITYQQIKIWWNTEFSIKALKLSQLPGTVLTNNIPVLVDQLTLLTDFNWLRPVAPFTNMD